jgi:5-methylcytosine-specific restriction protein B
MNHILYQDGILKALPFKRLPWWKGAEDQTDRFLAESVWENGYEDRYLDVVRQMRRGDRIVIKASFVRKLNLPFDVGGRKVSAHAYQGNWDHRGKSR